MVPLTGSIRVKLFLKWVFLKYALICDLLKCFDLQRPNCRPIAVIIKEVPAEGSLYGHARLWDLRLLVGLWSQRDPWLLISGSLHTLGGFLPASLWA